MLISSYDGEHAPMSSPLGYVTDYDRPKIIIFVVDIFNMLRPLLSPLIFSDRHLDMTYSTVYFIVTVIGR